MEFGRQTHRTLLKVDTFASWPSLFRFQKEGNSHVLKTPGKWTKLFAFSHPPGQTTLPVPINAHQTITDSLTSHFEAAKMTAFVVEVTTRQATSRLFGVSLQVVVVVESLEVLSTPIGHLNRETQTSRLTLWLICRPKTLKRDFGFSGIFESLAQQRRHTHREKLLSHCNCFWLFFLPTCCFAKSSSLVFLALNETQMIPSCRCPGHWKSTKRPPTRTIFSFSFLFVLISFKISSD